MAYVISDSCVSCGTCAGECPVGAISVSYTHLDVYKRQRYGCSRLPLFASIELTVLYI